MGVLAPGAVLIAALLVAGRAAADELEPVAEVEGIREYRLANGLEVLLFPDPASSTVTVNVTYRVGSRHEGRGEAGMAHLLEHMLFKGTPRFPDVWDALEDRGASFNGTTWVDRTNYYETLPASDENLRFALELEADRMTRSTLREEDLATEMTVVRNEFEAGENDPLEVLRERMLATAYLWHGYGRPTIGNRSDIERVPVERLRRFYETYYQPDNAMLVVAGHVDPAFALQAIQATLGAIPRPERELREPYTEEPPQDGPRAVELRRVGKVASAAVLYHIPAGSHPDLPAIEVLGEVLAGEPSGRLYEELVGTGRASRIFHAAYGWHDPGVFGVQVEIPPDGDARAVLTSMIETLESLPGSVGDVAVTRARNKLRKDMRLALADSRRIAIALSDAEAQGDWRLLFLQRDALDDVTREDVERVARAYLVESNRTAGLFLPTETPQRVEIPPAPDLAARLEGYAGRDIARGAPFEASPENIERSTRRTRAGAIELALLPKQTRGGIVRASLRFEYGSAVELRDHATALELLPELLARGTQRLDYAELSAELDRIETELAMGGEPGALEVELRAPRERLTDALGLLAEMLRTPRLDSGQLEIVRNEHIARVERMRTDPQGLLFDALYRALEPYPRDSIHYRPTFSEQIDRLRGVTRDELVALHTRHLGAGHAQAAFVGDFDPDAVVRLLQERLADWRSDAPYERIARTHLPVRAAERTLDTPDKEMTVVARGTAFPLRDAHPDYPALLFANYVLGQSPSSRLVSELRQKRGLSYGAGSFLRAASLDDVAQLAAYAICAPQNAREAQQVIRDEIQRWLSEPIPADEIAGFRSGYVERFKNRLSDDAWVARQLRDGLRTERPFTFHAEVVNAATRLTGADLQAALERHLGNAAFVELAAGDAGRFADAQLSP